MVPRKNGRDGEGEAGKTGPKGPAVGSVPTPPLPQGSDSGMLESAEGGRSLRGTPPAPPSLCPQWAEAARGSAGQGNGISRCSSRSEATSAAVVTVEAAAAAAGVVPSSGSSRAAVARRSGRSLWSSRSAASTQLGGPTVLSSSWWCGLASSSCVSRCTTVTWHSQHGSSKFGVSLKGGQRMPPEGRRDLNTGRVVGRSHPCNCRVVSPQQNSSRN